MDTTLRIKRIRQEKLILMIYIRVEQIRTDATTSSLREAARLIERLYVLIDQIAPSYVVLQSTRPS